MNFIKDFKIGGNRVLTHVVFWAMIILGNTVIYGSRDGEYLKQFIIESASLPSFLLAAYGNLYVLLPLYLAKRKYIVYFFLLLLLLFASFNFLYFYFAPLVRPYVSIPRQQITSNGRYTPFMLWHMFWVLTPLVFITTSIKLFKQWYFEEKEKQELVREKLRAELNYLKGQVHPHFLFNTLNNLYALTLQKSEDAPKIVLKLSELMSYMLYDTQVNKIELSREISHIRNYVDLEKIRYGNRLAVSFNVYGDVNGKKIAPLLLIPFVENAFKHGASNLTEDCWVTIDIKAKEDTLAVKVENNKSKTSVAKVEGDYRFGIGLTNVQRRLALLYDGKHELHIEDEPEHYAIDLNLDLKETTVG